jgi:hypothetical protein
MEDILKDFLCWQPPITLKTTWADHLSNILLKHNNCTTSGWFLKLLYPDMGTKGALVNIESKIFYHLYEMLRVIPRRISIGLLAKMWGVSKRSINRYLSMSTFIADEPCNDALELLSIPLNKNATQEEVRDVIIKHISPQPARKRTGEQRTPLAKEMDHPKKQITGATPQKINDLKADNYSLKPKLLNTKFKSSTVSLKVIDTDAKKKGQEKKAENTFENSKASGHY